MARFVPLGLLFALVGVSSRFLRHRSQYERFLESGILSLLLVIMYNLLCNLVAGLPSEPRIISAPTFLAQPVTRTGFPIVCQVLILAAVLMTVVAVVRRKALGRQEVEEGLLTSGIYRYSRHPMYTSIVWISLGLPLTSQNLDGLLVFPGVLFANVAQATAEERWDVGPRLQVAYEE